MIKAFFKLLLLPFKLLLVPLKLLRVLTKLFFLPFRLAGKLLKAVF